MTASDPESCESHPKRVHLNHAGASPSPKRVLDRVFKHLRQEQKDGGYAAQNAVQDSGELDKVYEDIAKLIHLVNSSEDSDDSAPCDTGGAQIALVESATVGWTRAFYAFVQRDELERRARSRVDCSRGNTRVILVSEAEYAANLVAACQWARDNNKHWMVLGIPSSTNKDNSSTGMVDLKVFDSMLKGTFRYKNEEGQDIPLDPSCIALVCITHVPTNSGIVNPVEEIGMMISAYNERQKRKADDENSGWAYNDSIKYLVDACQSVGQLDVDVRKLKCDGLVATGRKYLRGPRGTGFLFLSSSMLSHNIMPSHIDHYGCPISSVPSMSSYQPGTQLQESNVIEFLPRQGAKRFEFWESSVSSRVGLGEAVRLATEMGLGNIENEIRKRSLLIRYTLEDMIPSIMIHHRETSICGIVTFYSKNRDSRSIISNMWKEGFELSLVPATSTPLDSSRTGVPDLVRVSLSYMTTEKEIYSFCETLASYLNKKAETRNT